MRRRLVFICLLLCTTGVPAQSLTDFNQGRIDHQRQAMLTLGGWAIVNIGAGLALRANTQGVDRRFYEMNAIWNTVNLGIAGLGLLTAMRENPGALDLFDSISKHEGFQKTLLFNAGLDFGYIAGGLYMIERARRPEVNADLWKGYGRAVILQGGFLLVFDLVNYFIAHGRDQDLRLLLGTAGEGIGLTFRF